MNLLRDIAFIGSGILLTLALLCGGLIIGIALGVIFALARNGSHYRSFFIDRIVSVLRGTPLILQLSFIYFSIPMQLSILASGILAFGLNSAAYISEILRSGINSIPTGQFEAAISLRIPKWLMWRDIILPQVIRNVFPSFVNESIALLKETALISTIGGMDIMRRGQSIAAEEFSYFAPLLIVAIYYYVLVLIIEKLGKFIEKKIHFLN